MRANGAWFRLNGRHDLQHADAAGLRVVPMHVDIPEAHAITALGTGLLVGWARVLGQALLDQLDQRLTQALATS